MKLTSADIKMVCTNCSQILQATHFMVYDKNNKPKNTILGYSRDKSDFWICDNCGTLNLVEAANNNASKLTDDLQSI